MPCVLIEQLRLCANVHAVLNCVLSRSLELTGTKLGNLQLMDWQTGFLVIAEQRGFDSNFLNVFDRVNAADGTACARAIRRRRPVVVPDVELDRDFAPYRAIAIEAGFRAVQSTPLISTSGALLGVLSTHFPATHGPSESEMAALKMVGELAANAIIHYRTRHRGVTAIDAQEAESGQIARALAAVERSRELLRRMDKQRRSI
jgi:GAF domain-containing protein